MARIRLAGLAALACLLLASCGRPPRDIAPPSITTYARASFDAASFPPSVGITLYAGAATWSPSPTSVAYQWQDCNSLGQSCLNISGATGQAYVVQASDEGYALVVVVTATFSGGRTASQASPPTGLVPSSASADYYVAQSSAGSGNGTSCANAAAVSTLSSSTEWTAGNVIGLCGTITSSITAQGSGSSGNPITVVWEPGATMSQAYCPTTGCFNTNGKTYLTLNGESVGSIQATANGSGLANQQSGNGISATGCNNCVIENLTIQNIYQHTSSSDTSGNAQSTGGIAFNGASNITIAGNTIDNTATGVYDDPSNGDSNIQITGNNIYDIDWGVAIAEQANITSVGSIYVYGNHFHDWSNWDTTADEFHHNGIYCFTGSSVTSLPDYTGFYVYDNQFDGAVGADGTAMVWPGGSPGGSETSNPACGTSASNWYVFNNVFNPTDNTPGDAEIYPTCCDVRVWNNTLIAPSTTGNRLFDAEYGGTIDLRNNLFDDASQLVNVDTSTITFSPAPDYDYFANGGSNSFVCNGYYSFPSGLSNWQSCSGGDSHATAYNGTFSLNSDGSLPPGNPAIGAGENLYSTCNGQATPGLGALCSNINGTARPSSGSWNPGAF